MVINGVSFNDEVCFQMGKKAFVRVHENAFFLDREIEVRRKILEDTYDIIKANNGNNRRGVEYGKDVEKELLAGGYELSQRKRRFDP